MENIKKEIQRAIDSHTKKHELAVERIKEDAMSAIKFNHHIAAAYSQQIAKNLTAILESGKLSEDDFIQRVEIYKRRLSNTVREQEDIIMHSVTVEMISLMETYAEINP